MANGIGNYQPTRKGRRDPTKKKRAPIRLADQLKRLKVPADYNPALIKPAKVEGFVVTRPYPFIICNATSPDKCVRRPCGKCSNCWSDTRFAG